MVRRPPRSTRTYTLVPYTTLFRSSTALLAPAVMLNILGDVWFEPGATTPREPDWAAVLAVPSAKLHLYGKQDARRGRKMGHVTLVAATLEQAHAGAARVAGALGKIGRAHV